LIEREIVTEDLNLAIEDLRGQGFRLDIIYPADDPKTALLTRAGQAVRVTVAGAPALSDGLPAFKAAFVLTRSGSAPGQGRAGMLYRDLIPSRLGGRYIASHITIPEGGPVADWVHYHRVTLQMLYVRRGWVRVVYEDQGDSFVMSEGDLVLQPPEIRHRVLESSAGLEVVEISAPALHETLADHELALPNGSRAERLFGGQRFLHHVASAMPWAAFGDAEAQETAMADATAGIATARTIRPAGEAGIAFERHAGELVFGFVLDGCARLEHDAGFDLRPADSFVIPPDGAWRLNHMSKDFRLLHVTTSRLDAGGR
jgi:mannose-6-phosphate isomerase-like protein (cupin superfamily)